MAYSYDHNTYQPAKHDAYPNTSQSRHSYGYSRYSANDDNTLQSPNHIPMTRTRSRDSRYDYNYGRSYDSRSYHEQNIPPPPPRPQENKSSVMDQRKTINLRTWPPQPTVEDEGVSLAKEFPRPKLHSVRSDEVCMRGTVNQDPVLIELDNNERRFVLIPKHDDKSQNQGESEPKAIPEQQARESRQRQREPQPALKLDVDQTNIFAPRQPSPYAFTRTPKTPSNRSSQEYFLSPDAITPPSSNISKLRSQKDEPETTKKQSRTEHPRDKTSRSEASDESDLDAAHVARLRAREAKPRVSFHEARKDSSKRYSSDLSDYEDPRSIRKQDVYQEERKVSLQVPRSTPADSYLADDDLNRPSSRALPLPRPIPKSHRSESVYTSRPSRNEFVRPGSPSSSDAFFQTPPASPKMVPRSSVSKPVSRTASRPSSPVASSFDLNQASFSLSRGQTSQADRSSTYPPSTQQRAARPTSKLSSAMRQESVEPLKLAPRVDIQSPLPVRPVAKPPLPYPDDAPDVLMPSHEAFQIPADGLSAPFQARTISRPPSVTPTTPSWTTSTSRPTLASRHTLDRDIPRARAESVRTASYQSTVGSQTSYQTTTPTQTSYAHSTAPSQTSYAQSITPAQTSYQSTVPSQTTTTSTITVVPTILPPCPRKEYSSKYDDWYTLDGASSFVVCPHCLDEIVRPTAFRGYFKRALSRPATVRTRCDFGSPWTRLAWLLTLKRQRQDLDLIYALAAIANIEPKCPGAREAVGTWYGLRDQSGQFISKFAICSFDLKSLETLFPSLLGAFTRLPESGNLRNARICSLRTESRRWKMYLDLIVAIDDKARASSRVSALPDLKPLYDLLDSHAYKSECQRDRIVLDQTWHFMPTLPDLTICEECYDQTVWPVIKSGSDLAERFNRVLMPVPPTATRQFEGGASCQLYSPRMRRVWERAVRYGDDEGFRYLIRKVRERKDVHQDLLLQQVNINKRLLDRGNSGVDKEWLRRELDRIEEEWSEWE
jgi:hypothetical protein